MNLRIINTIQLWLMGLALAVVVLIARAAIDAGVHPIHIAFIQALGSFLFLLITGAGKGLNLKTIKTNFTYFLTASLLGFTLPQLIVFSSVAHVGVGVASLSYSLPLMVAYLLSIKIGMEAFNLKSLLFLLISVVGTLVYFFQKEFLLTFEASNVWNLIILLSPISIGIANVYRSLKWPGQVPVGSVALLTNLFSTATYVLLILAVQPGFSANFNFNLEVAVLLISQMLLAGVGQMLLFTLQKNSGPVFIGQTGSIVTLFGGVLGYLFYNEMYSYSTLLGSVMILVGVYCYCKFKSFNETSIAQKG